MKKSKHKQKEKMQGQEGKQEEGGKNLSLVLHKLGKKWRKIRGKNRKRRRKEKPGGRKRKRGKKRGNIIKRGGKIGKRRRKNICHECFINQEGRRGGKRRNKKKENEGRK